MSQPTPDELAAERKEAMRRAIQRTREYLAELRRTAEVPKDAA